MPAALILITALAASPPASARLPERSLRLNACTTDCIDADYKVSAGEIRRVFPEIDAEDKIVDIESVEYWVRPVTIIYAAKVTAPHTARVKKLSCKLGETALECLYSPESQYFLDDPALSFTKSDDISLDEALLIERLLRDGKTIDADGKKLALDATHQRVYDMRIRDGAIALDFGTGACSDIKDVSIEGSGDDMVLKMSFGGLFCS